MANTNLVLHVDIDSFFVQVEQLRHPQQLANKPVAIQQHQEIIAANAAAKDAGVRKHDPPSLVRTRGSVSTPLTLVLGAHQAGTGGGGRVARPL